MFKKTILFASVSVALLSPLSAQESLTPLEAPVPASNPALDAIMEHVPYLDSSWKSTFGASVHEGETQAVAFTAAVQFQDKNHFFLDLGLTVQDDFEGEKEMQFTVLADGTFIYLESPSMAELSGGMASGPVKVELALFEEMTSSLVGGAPAEAEEGLDKNAIKEMISGALEGFTFKEEGSGEGLRRFTLVGEEGNGMIAFEKEHWFLSSMEMSFGEGKAVVNVTDSAIVEEFPAGTFTFTVSEGQTVMDLTPMLRMSMPQDQAGVADDDLEF